VLNDTGTNRLGTSCCISKQNELPGPHVAIIKDPQVRVSQQMALAGLNATYATQCRCWFNNEWTVVVCVVTTRVNVCEGGVKQPQELIRIWF
jgi:hypothetical protein